MPENPYQPPSASGTPSRRPWGRWFIYGLGLAAVSVGAIAVVAMVNPFGYFEQHEPSPGTRATAALLLILNFGVYFGALTSLVAGILYVVNRFRR